MSTQINHPLSVGTKIVVNVYCKSCFIGRNPPKNHVRTQVAKVEQVSGLYKYTVLDGLKFMQDEIIQVLED